MDTLIQWAVGLLVANPHFAVVATVLTFARMVFKPLCSAIQVYVNSTETKADDLWWSGVQDSKIFKSVTYVLDLLLSIKLPKAPDAPAVTPEQK